MNIDYDCYVNLKRDEIVTYLLEDKVLKIFKDGKELFRVEKYNFLNKVINRAECKELLNSPATISNIKPTLKMLNTKSSSLSGLYLIPTKADYGRKLPECMLVVKLIVNRNIKTISF